MKILAFSDIHGNTEAVQRLVSEVAVSEFDIIVFGGDFTNAIFDGVDEGTRQMEKIVSLIESMERPFYFVYGNRDFEFSNRHVYCPIGYNIDEKDWSIDEYTLTSHPEKVDTRTILVTHELIDELRFSQTPALLYLYGHDHVGRLYKNYLDLGFLHRDAAHGAKPLFGCYWFLELNGTNVKVKNHSWELKESHCSTHSNQGVFYIPQFWRKDCALCYDEERDRFHF